MKSRKKHQRTFRFNSKRCIICGNQACQIVNINGKYTDFCKRHKLSKLLRGELMISDKCHESVAKISKTYYEPKKYV